jgi:hypothetical protein
MKKDEQEEIEIDNSDAKILNNVSTNNNILARQ